MSARQIERSLPHALLLNNHLGQTLVHRAGGCRNTRADIRNMRHLQQTLNGAVLAADAVHHREHAVYMNDLRAGFTHDDETVGLSVRRQNRRNRFVVLFPRVVLDAVKVLGLNQTPSAVAGDAYRINCVFFLVYIPQNGCCRNTGNRVLGGHAAEHYHDVHFIHKIKNLCIVKSLGICP